ncbi:glycoside hydrolase family 130 protein [Microbacterium sp. GCS4]|uniref:glycoside hydrolase family 130 protein n=1 Tax=Microbacterium sp. GCS4 TaxID=1692239 RepID=UPI0006811CEE|nr:glycosidase [Microbacterium sp. GCS4]KNY04139.1 glycosidase [Microbacterium sp. GCS4]
MTPSPTAAPATAIPYALTRIGTIMTADPHDPLEVEGVLNPGTAWGPDGELYLFPRVVAEGNVSRVARARVILEGGVPVGVERLGVVLSPDEQWEHGHGNAGVEDPRITFLEPLGVHVMTYIAYGPLGPKPALAYSDDTVTWHRLGPLQFAYQPELRTDLNLFANKDIVFFPEVVPGPDGEPSIALLHRPMWDLDWLRPGEGARPPAGIDDDRPSIWIGYVDLDAARADISALTRVHGSSMIAGPERKYESAKIGAGPSPLRVPEGWLLVHHGVSGQTPKGFELAYGSRYSAGAILLDVGDPRTVLARSDEPLLAPETVEELQGTLGNVVFPTAIEEIEGRTFVFYGMADSSIGVAELTHI